jgi:phosphatidylserine decarboxylase
MLSSYGRREWVLVSLVCGLVAIAPILLGWWWLVGVVFLAWFALVMFFRDPPRKVPRLEAADMLSPADGTISAVERVDDHPCTRGPAVIVRVFLSVLNVHVNRAPCDGEVVKIEYVPGRFLDARSAESARVNEFNLITLRRPDGETIGVRQVSGAIARRIVCAIDVGQQLERGERFGMIKFGSTTELILPRPDDVEVHVEVGDRVRGGLTRLASLAPATEEKP